MSAALSKQQVFDTFDRKISKSAIKPIQGSAPPANGVLGKYCEIEYMGDGIWDLYLRNPDSPTSQLSGRRINQFCEKFSSVQGRLMRLDGEAWVQGHLEESGLKQAILSELKWLGIRKAPEYSPEQRAAMADRLKKVREAIA